LRAPGTNPDGGDEVGLSIPMPVSVPTWAYRSLSLDDRWSDEHAAAFVRRAVEAAADAAAVKHVGVGADVWAVWVGDGTPPKDDDPFAKGRSYSETRLYVPKSPDEDYEFCGWIDRARLAWIDGQPFDEPMPTSPREEPSRQPEAKRVRESRSVIPISEWILGVNR
jgi:hypothetical protein